MMPRPRLQEELAYHPPELKKVVSPAEKVLQAVLVAVVGTGLGIGVGVFLAGRTLPSTTSAAVSQAPTSEKAPAVAIAQPKTNQVDTQVAPAAPAQTGASSTIQAPPKSQTSVAKTIPVAAPASSVRQHHQPSLLKASLTGQRIGLRRRHGLRHKATLAAMTLPKLKTPPPVEEAKLEIPDGRFRFTIEGDQTAVAYDAQSGVVSTDGPGSFVLEKAAGEEPTLIRPQVTPSNIHYKCDQDANCSLIMASVVVPHARMRTISHTTDWAYVPVSTDRPMQDGSQGSVYFGHVSR